MIKKILNYFRDRREHLPKVWMPVVLFGILQLAVAIVLLPNPATWSWIFWSCYHVSLLYIFAFWQRRPQVIFGILHLGLVVQISWVIDFFGHVFGYNTFNLTNYLFESGPLAIKVIAVLTHVIVPVAVLCWTYTIRPRPISLLYSGIYLIVLYIATLLITPPVENVNCVFHICAYYMPTWHYTLLWPFYMSIMIGGTFLVHLLAYKMYSKKRR